MKTIIWLFFLIVPAASSAQPLGKDCEDLVFNTRELTRFAYNSPCKTESYPFISLDGNHLYYTNNQTYNWLFYTHKDSATKIWSVPVPLAIDNFNTPIMSSYLSHDLSVLYFTTSENRLYMSKSIDGSKAHFSQPEEIELLNNTQPSQTKFRLLTCISFSSDMNSMYAYSGYQGAANTMTEFRKTGENSYTFLRTVSDKSDEIGVLGKGGLVYYFTNNTHKNILFAKTRRFLTEDFSAVTYVVRIFEPNLNVTQVRIAEKEGGMVMVLSESVWDKNDVYFYDKWNRDTGFYHVFDEMRTPNNSDLAMPALQPVLIDEKEAPEPLRKVEILNQAGSGISKIEIGTPFPNPGKDHFFIYYNVSGENINAPKPLLLIIDNSGRTVYSIELDDLTGEAKISPQDIPSGVYYIRIDYNGLSSSLSRITLSF